MAAEAADQDQNSERHVPNAKVTKTSAHGRTRHAATEPSLDERDELYGLISVLYHALQGAETYESYVTDAEDAGDEELRTFFEEVQDEELERAERAKQLLAVRLARATQREEASADSGGPTTA
jgi:hypothetical protein